MQPNFLHYKEFSDDGKLKKVITCAYKVDPETGIVKYGAAKYTKDNPKEHWNRKLHVTRATVRWLNNPVTINFGKLPKAPRSFQYRRLEEYLIKCFYKYGLEFHPEKDPSKDKSFEENRRNIKLTIFDPELTEEEELQLYGPGLWDTFCDNLDLVLAFIMALWFLSVFNVTIVPYPVNVIPSMGW